MTEEELRTVQGRMWEEYVESMIIFTRDRFANLPIASTINEPPAFTSGHWNLRI